MSISFSSIPSDIRVPLVYIEFDNSQAVKGTPQVLHKTLLLGLRNDDGEVEAGVPTRITSKSSANAAFGRGSMLSSMATSFINANNYSEVWAIALDDKESVQANGRIKFAGTCSQSGMLHLLCAGSLVNVVIRAGMTEIDIAREVATKLNTVRELPLSASIDGDSVVLTCKWGGETGNDIDVRVNYYQGQTLPAGIGITIEPMSQGVGNPDLSNVITQFGDTWWNYIVNPFTDTANLNVLRDELVERWGPLRMIDGTCFMAFRGTLAQTSTFGTARNDYLLSTIATGLSPHPTWIWASAVAAVAAQSLSIDPARPLQTLKLPGILPPARQDRWELKERNLLLYDGISTFNVDAGDNVQLERVITMYRKNRYGDPDPSYLDIETIATLSYIRYATRVRITQKFPRHKLADDGTRFAPGQAIVTPSIVRTELLALFTELEWQGLVENFEQYKTTLLVERDENDRNRVNVRDNPDLVNQFRIYAQAVQFYL